MTPVLPDAFYIRRCDAADIAMGVVQAIHAIGRPIYLYLTPAGEIGFEVRLLDTEPDGEAHSLVGCYTEASSATQIRDDILASQREPIL